MDKVESIIGVLKKEYPNAGIALKFGNVFELLVAVILSAQCTDVRVNMVTPPLFRKFKDAEAFAGCDVRELEKMIYSTGFYRQKAKSIKGAAKKIVEEFDGKVPEEMEALLKLPGVARKTANVILNEGFGKSEGVVVDTHVIRLSGLLGLVPKKDMRAKNAVKIERDLMKKVPREDWAIFPHLLMAHGRTVCIARRPKCAGCVLNKVCPSAFKAPFKV